MHQERYAIVGFGFRMPGGITTADSFWQLLSERGFIREPVADRYGPGYEPVGGESGPGRFGSGYEGLMRGDEPYLFDCHLFGMSAREASVTDPQLRMLLTCTWEAFEQAGWDPVRLRDSRTGVFVGAQVSASGNWRPLHGPNEFMVTGLSLAMLPNRISYTFNLTGPSATYMTACSSGATALHAAVTALAHGDCDQAVVGAASYLGSAYLSAGFARLGVISPDGGCRSFDAMANGYMRSEGVFVYLVKPLAAAEADGDRILAVIAGTAVNTAGAADGATGTGPGRVITAPTQHAQVALMRAACARAGLSPREVDYLEAHATGTRVGDRIEGNAIGQVFGRPDRAVPLRIASVKSNVGHMEAAAFGCALLKVLLMFERRTYAPVSRHFAVPNPDIDFTRLRVQTECEPFGEAPVVAGINSFGFGGANAHCLLTEYRPERALSALGGTAPGQRPAQGAGHSAPLAPGAACLVPLSARSPEALRETARELGKLVTPLLKADAADAADAGVPELDLYTLAGNLSTRRTHFATRTAFAVTGMADLAAQLDAFADEAPAAAAAATIGAGRGEPRVLMVFAGQGTQWAGCGRELYATEPVFAEAVDAVDAAWRELAGFSLREECFGAPQERLDECQLAQPVIFMIEVALTELLRSWGVRPACVIGHSAGEVAAAYAAGIYTLEEATRLIFHRAVQQQRTAGSGRMLAVGLDRAGTQEILRELVAPTLEIACENAPASTAACGSAADVALAVALLEQRGITHRLLRGNVAFHSRAMDVLEADLRASLAFLGTLPMTADVPFISSVTGEVTENLDAAYWWTNVRYPVRFAAAVETALRDFRPDVVIEVAPHTALLPSVRHCVDDQYLDAAAVPACVPTLTRGADTRISFHGALAALYREGLPLDFAARYPRVRPVSHLLPPHPRDERRVMDPAVDDAFFLRRGEYSAGPLLGRRIPGDRLRFEVRMSAADFPWLADHRVQNTSIVPAAGYVEMVLQALGGAPAHFSHVEFRKPCVLSDTPARLRTELEPEPGSGPQPDAFSFRITSSSYDDEAASGVLHCTGKVRRLSAPPDAPGIDSLDRSRFAAGRYGSRKAFYEQMAAVIGEYFQYGPHFQVVDGTLEDPRTKELLLDIRVGAGLWRDSQRAGYLFQPALLDGGLQTGFYYLMECSDISMVPQRMEDFTIDRLPTSGRLTCHYVPPSMVGLHERGQLALPLGEQVSGSLTFYDAATGQRVAHLGTYVGSFANPRQDVLARSRHVVRWQPKFVDAAIAEALASEASPSLPGLLAALRAGAPSVLRVAEFAQDATPEETAVGGYLGDDSHGDVGGGVEFWLLGADQEVTRRLFEAFGRAGAQAGMVRFAVADLSDPASAGLTGGLLREAACDLVIADARTAGLTPAAWGVIRRLLVPGGIALVRHPGDGCAPAEAGWTRLDADEDRADTGTGQTGEESRRERAALWAAPTELFDDGPAEPEGPRWLIAGSGGLADAWVRWMAPADTRVAMESLDPAWLWSTPAQDEMRGLRAVDFFADEPGDGDPLGELHLTLIDRDQAGRRDADWVRHASGIAQYFPGTDVHIDIVRGDVCRRDDVDRVIAGVTRPLKGVFHLAAVLDDHQLADITPESVAAVFAPKAGGAWHLHQATLDQPLDHFVLLSSVASVVGNAGQSVYAAANAFLDGLAAYRRGRWLPALTFNMAALAEVGMAARQTHVLRLARASGMPPVSLAVAIANLDAALRGGDTDHIVCADIGQLPGDAGHPDFMRTGRWMRDSVGAGEGLTPEVIAGELCREIGRLSGHERVEPRETIASFGVNSVSIAELSAFIRTRFGHHVGILDLMTTATPESVANAIVSGRTAQRAGQGPGASDEAGAGRVRSDEITAAAGADASLPAQCQEDLEFLQRTVHDLMSAAPAGPAVPPDRFTVVFLTGATGFVGRFVLAELLRQSDSLLVHCLVRADSPAHGLDRIREGMERAGIWDDAFAARIRVCTGDIGEPLFGLAEEDFTRLSAEVDAVYHLAADLNLISSYAAVRETNTRSFASVLELALTRRVKHIVYASTMGIFPQYFCNFAGEFAGLRIEDGAMPDIALMRSVLPPGLVGYPWSKLVVEESLLFARACGVPVAIMRLPQTGIAASTGYTQSTDIKVRIASAVLDTGLAPAGFRTQWTEPVDTVSEILVRLSLRPERRHSIYHLVNPAPSTHGLALADFGLSVREVPYAEFKRACQARGLRGPLHGHWALVDHFADLWFPAPDAEGPAWTQDRPVGVASVIADLGLADVGTAGLRWPGLITTTAQSLSWISRHAGEWPYQRPAVSLDVSSLQRQAREFASRLEVSFDEAYPPQLLEGLDRLVAALRAPAARIREDRYPEISFELSRQLWNRASLSAELARHPQIAREPVDRPVFILGINRTGTTLLHRLLARGTRFWAPYLDEIVHPALRGDAPADFDRRGYVNDLLAAGGFMTAMLGIHDVDTGEPEEEFALLEESFAAWTYSLRFAVPGYARWLAGRDAGFAYQVHRQAMRHLSWQRGTRLGAQPRQWLLKMPFHLAELPTLAAAYPDAVFVQTHRTPREFLPSWLSLAESFRSLSAEAWTRGTGRRSARSSLSS